MISIGRIVQFILMMVVIRVATQLLSPEEMGRMALVISITAFFAVVLVYHVGMFINRRLHAWNESGQIKRYFGYYWGYLLLTSLAAAGGITLISMTGVMSLPMHIGWLFILVCGSLLFNTANQTLIPALNMLEYRGWFISLTLLTIAIGLLFSVILVWRFGPRAEYWLLGQIIGQALIALVGGKVFFDRVTSSSSLKKPIHSQQVYALFAFAWPVGISVGFNWVQTQGYRFLMEDSSGLAILGLFVAGYGISAGVIAAIEIILTTYFQPKFYKQISKGTRKEQSIAWNEYARVLLPCILFSGMFVGVMAPEITKLLLGPAFQSAATFVMWGAAAEALRAAAGVLGLIAHARMNTRLLLIPHAIGAMIAMLVAWVLLPILGATGVGLALVVAGIATLIPMYFLMRTKIDMSVAPLRLLMSFACGVSIFFLAIAARWFVEGRDDLLVSISLLVPLSLVFLAFQFMMIFPFLQKERRIR